MHVLQVAAQVAALGEGLLAEGALEGAEACMLAEVVPQVATLLEDTAAVRIPALEVELHSLSLWVLHADGLVPLLRDTLEGLVLTSS